MEVDLGREVSIDRVALHAPEGRRSSELIVKWVDASGATTYEQSTVDWRLRGVVSPELEVRKQALLTLASLPDSRDLALSRLLTELRVENGLGETALIALATLTETGWPLGDDTSLGRLAGDLESYLSDREATELRAAPVVAAQALARDLVTQSTNRNRGFDAEPLRAALDAQRVTVVPIVPIPHQMLFDVTEFTVPAGRPVEIQIDNRDVMPHNVVITRPGGLEDVGRMAEAMAEENPLRAERSEYVPRRSSKLLFASRLIAPGEAGQLTFLAPQLPGRYPFVCTFPGHWILMNGIMTVVEGLDPDDAQITRRAGIEMFDLGEEAQVREFVRDWTLEELEGDADELDQGSAPSSRQVERGGALFTEVGCDSCHARKGQGGAVGPALDHIATIYGSRELLRHILEPSDEVAEEYETTLVETRDGRFYSGLVTAEDQETITLQANPLAPQERLTLRKSELDYREKSELSPMPSGMLSTLTREQILDLLRYLRADP